MLFFFRSSQAAKWFENIFREELNTKVFPIVIWLEFEVLFWSYFFLFNTKAEAVNKLEETTYYQGSCLVESCLKEFQNLISKTGYTNLHIIVVKFK